MESELKYFYKDGFTQFDVISEAIISEHLSKTGNMSYAMRSSYFDTSDQILRKSKSVLRIRRCNERYYLTLKMPVHTSLVNGKGIFERQEFEFELTEEEWKWDTKKGLNPSWFISRVSQHSHVEQDLKQLLRMIEGRPLMEVCLADYTRTAYGFAYRTSQFELCFDEGYLGTSEKIDFFSEMEIELLNGKREDLMALNTVLLNQLPIYPAQKSKYGRAIDIADRFK